MSRGGYLADAMSKRLFFALWPDDRTRKSCHDVARQLGGHGRVVMAANLHVTLVFLGATDRRQQALLSQAAARLSIAPMILRFDRLSYWKKPAIACLTASQCDQGVYSVVGALSNAAVDIGMTVDARPYMPHVTLLRKARSIPQLSFEAVVWRSDEISLVESVSTPAGVRYQVIDRW
jgi:RNA 2',3'-cyclic 3'-phosphodiesterase